MNARATHKGASGPNENNFRVIRVFRGPSYFIVPVFTAAFPSSKNSIAFLNHSWHER
jgi:hypothetical protein